MNLRTTQLVAAATVASLLTGSAVIDERQPAIAAGGVPRHVLTWTDWGGKMNSPDQYTAAQIAPYVNFILSTQGNAGDIAAGQAHAAGIKALVYSDPNRQEQPGGAPAPLYTSDETTFAHDCTGARPGFSKPGVKGVQQLMDPHSADLAAEWRAQELKEKAIAQTVSGGDIDYFFSDTADSVGYFSPLPCQFSQADFTNATNAMNRAFGLPIIFNGLNIYGGNAQGGGTTSAYGLLLSTPGGMAENCFITYGTFPNNKATNTDWINQENEIIDAAQLGKILVCHETDTTIASDPNAIDHRIWQYASFLLAYNVAYDVYATKYDTPTHFQMMVETGLVPMNPKIPTPSDISGLLQASQAYGREYRDCYFRGVDMGPCAAVVNHNKNGATEAFPFSGYTHTMVLGGPGGVLDGGVISFHGPAPVALGPGEAEVAFR